MQMGKEEKKKKKKKFLQIIPPFIFPNILLPIFSNTPPPFFSFFSPPQKPPLTNKNHQHRPLGPHRRRRLRPFILVDLAAKTHPRSVCAGRDGTVFRGVGAGSVADEVLSLLARGMGLVKWHLKSKRFVLFFCLFFLFVFFVCFFFVFFFWIKRHSQKKTTSTRKNVNQALLRKFCDMGMCFFFFFLFFPGENTNT